MSIFKPEISGDSNFAANQLFDLITNVPEWNKSSMPDTLSLRRIIALVDWAVREPKRWLVFRMFYIDGITNIHTIASRLHIAERTVRRYLCSVDPPFSASSHHVDCPRQSFP